MFRILALWLALAASPLLAQTLIVGQVADGDEPLPNTAVRVMGPNGPVSQTVTDAQGNFQLNVPNGSYRLVARPLGYQPVMRPIEASGTPIKLGILKAIASATELDEAKVEAQASRALLGMDRKVYDVASDLNVQGGTGTDVLRQVPNVSLDMDGNVQLRGDENVTILIDGRPASLLGFTGTNAFDRLPAGSVQRVEVITNPGAQFDAQGSGGVINIVTKKNRELPLNGSVVAGAGTNRKYNASTSISVPVGKVRIFSSLSWDDRWMYSGGTIERIFAFPDTAYRQDHQSWGDNHSQGLNGRLGLDVPIGKNWSANLSVGRNQESREEWDSTDFNNSSGAFVTTAVQGAVGERANANSDAALRLERKFKKDGEKWTFDLNYSDRWRNETTNNFFDADSNYPKALTYGGVAVQRFDETETTRNLNLQTDAEQILNSKSKVTFGGRSTYFARDNVREASYLETPFSSSFIEDTLRTQYVDQEQWVHALYATYGYVFNTKWKAQAGMRYEVANLNFVLKNGTAMDFTYPGYFPSVFLTYSPKKGTDFQASYAMRVNRPGERELNPLIDYSNPQSFRKGNPLLQPEYTHAFELSAAKYAKWGSATLSGYVQHTTNMFSRFLEVDNTGFVTVTWANYDTRDRFGLSGNTMARLGKKWSLQASGDAFWSVINAANLQAGLTQSGFGWQGRANAMYNPSPAHQIQLTFNQWGAGPTGQGYFKGIQFFDLGYKYDLIKNKLNVNVRLSDVFKQRRFQVEQHPPFTDIYFMRFRESQIGFVTLQYNFGKPDRTAGRGGRGGRGMGGGMEGGGGDDMGM
ncbi:MAG: TonB-dependent receptor domain-containing protein [Schleiferiaceae bacterium]